MGANVKKPETQSFGAFSPLVHRVFRRVQHPLRGRQPTAQGEHKLALCVRGDQAKDSRGAFYLQHHLYDCPLSSLREAICLRRRKNPRQSSADLQACSLSGSSRGPRPHRRDPDTVAPAGPLFRAPRGAKPWPRRRRRPGRNIRTSRSTKDRSAPRRTFVMTNCALSLLLPATAPAPPPALPQGRRQTAALGRQHSLCSRGTPKSPSL